ncbi:G patch domain and ankyrin repeat-containing protein 1 -like protein [Trichinella pseudospiralis]|uniref:G patch domain and ankyrin repeat-containing protein 1-like protein n=1 Tax=Trichinella pseudospiralis TaxID=6337 RepID=A0A0V1G1R6_TRIPS|nr:G patch domain and ankyrin repeat-containing protein 1 -like protein [Trichinella pseudospiralis]
MIHSTVTVAFSLMFLPFDKVKFVSGSEKPPISTSSREEQSNSSTVNGDEIQRFYVKELPCCSSDYKNFPDKLSTHYQVKATRKHVERRCLPTSSSSSRSTALNRFFKAASEGDNDALLNCLLKDRIGINETDDFRWTALMCAAYAGHLNTVMFLLQYGAEPEIKNQKAKTASNLAADNGQYHIENLLKEFLLERQRLQSSVSDSGFAEASTAAINVEQQVENFCTSCNRPYSDPHHHTSTGHLFQTWQIDLQPCFSINSSNIGYKMMVKSGWKETTGLGKEEKGRHYPVKTALKRDRYGLGLKKQKCRISHFSAFDSTAVVTVKKPSVQPSLGKKSAYLKNEKDRHIARTFRRQFYSDVD